MAANVSGIYRMIITHHPPKQLAVVLNLLFLLYCPCATPLTFNFSSFTSNDINTISLEGDAYMDGRFLRLTRSAADDQQDQSVGRATYHKSFLLRDNSTGKLADFTASFTFIIDSQKRSVYGDGLAFFLAPNGSLLNNAIGRGGGLGLPVEVQQMGNESTTLFPFVAVEFDIFKNDEPVIQDPFGDHVGMDISSLKSTITTPWNGGVAYGRENNATVSYNSSSKKLSVSFTNFVDVGGTNGTLVQMMSYLDYKVDLNQYLPDRVIVGLSASTGSLVALYRINSWSFNSTSMHDESATTTNTSVLLIPAASPSVDYYPNPKSGNGKIKRGLVVGLGFGGSLFLVGGMIFLFFVFRKKSAPEMEDSSDDDPLVYDLIDDEFEKGTGPRKFSYSELAVATSNFEEGQKLGEGGFGGVYRGFIKDLNSYVAVKRISKRSQQGLKEYASEVRIISRLRHRNLVQLIGWCHEKKLLLVYELMPNGSLDSYLFKEKGLLTWEARYKIALGLASGLLYLHQEWEQCVLHRDIKASNVMLDLNFNAKLGDFGLARLVDHGKQSQTTVVAGTMGYMAPEYATIGKASKATDVFSFGVVALEIACGRKPIEFLRFEMNQINMVEWVWGLYGEGRVLEAADPKLCGDFDEEQMECLMIVGLWCAHPDYNLRPSMQQAIQALNFEISLPILPSKMPVATYSAPSVSLPRAGPIEIEA